MPSSRCETGIVVDATRPPEIPRTDDGWKPPLPGAFIQPSQALIDDNFSDNLCTGRNVPDLLCEEARTLLLDDGCCPTAGNGLLVALSSATASLDLTSDTAVSQVKGEAAHSALGGERQQVVDLERLIVGIDEALLEHDSSEASDGFGTKTGVA